MKFRGVYIAYVQLLYTYYNPTDNPDYYDFMKMLYNNLDNPLSLSYLLPHLSLIGWCI